VDLRDQKDEGEHADGNEGQEQHNRYSQPTEFANRAHAGIYFGFAPAIGGAPICGADHAPNEESQGGPDEVDFQAGPRLRIDSRKPNRLKEKPAADANERPDDRP
jgi:hypothetical protein